MGPATAELWRTGNGARGYGPCGQFGERDPCLLGFAPEDDINAIIHVAPAPAPAPIAAALPSLAPEVFNKTNRLGSFLVIGDWGWDGVTHGNVKSTTCQTTIGNAMLEKMKQLGDVKFVINVGDSFYPCGVTSKNDPQWDTKWRSVYAEELRSVPWYSVYGNHDYQHDPCACSPNPQECAQVNADITDNRFFYMPGPNWHKEHPELDLEVIGLDLNQMMDAWNGKLPFVPADCAYTPCKAACEANLAARAKGAMELFDTRMNASQAKNVVVFSHYPTDYLWGAGDMMDKMKSPLAPGGTPRHVEYFGGHRHNVDQTSTASIAPNNNWLVGGGGGWSCDGGSQGFVVGEISKGAELKTYPVLVDYDTCCGNLQFK